MRSLLLLALPCLFVPGIKSYDGNQDFSSNLRRKNGEGSTGVDYRSNFIDTSGKHPVYKWAEDSKGHRKKYLEGQFNGDTRRKYLDGQLDGEHRKKYLEGQLDGDRRKKYGAGEFHDENRYRSGFEDTSLQERFSKDAYHKKKHDYIYSKESKQFMKVDDKYGKQDRKGSRDIDLYDSRSEEKSHRKEKIDHFDSKSDEKVDLKVYGDKEREVKKFKNKDKNGSRKDKNGRKDFEWNAKEYKKGSYKKFVRKEMMDGGRTKRDVKEEELRKLVDLFGRRVKRVKKEIASSGGDSSHHGSEFDDEEYRRIEMELLAQILQDDETSKSAVAHKDYVEVDLGNRGKENGKVVEEVVTKTRTFHSCGHSSCGPQDFAHHERDEPNPNEAYDISSPERTAEREEAKEIAVEYTSNRETANHERPPEYEPTNENTDRSKMDESSLLESLKDEILNSGIDVEFHH